MLSLATIVTVVIAAISGLVGVLLGHSRGKSTGLAQGQEAGYNKATQEQTTRASQQTAEIAVGRVHVDEKIAGTADDAVADELLKYARDRASLDK